jgi:hypothetical protein
MSPAGMYRTVTKKVAEAPVIVAKKTVETTQQVVEKTQENQLMLAKRLSIKPKELPISFPVITYLSTK